MAAVSVTCDSPLADVHQRAPIRTAQCMLRVYMNRCGKQAALAWSCATCSTRSHASCVIAAFHGRQRASGMCACTASYDTCKGTGAVQMSKLAGVHRFASAISTPAVIGSGGGPAKKNRFQRLDSKWGPSYCEGWHRPYFSCRIGLLSFTQNGSPLHPCKEWGHRTSTIAVHPLKLGVAEVTLHPRIPVLEIRFSTALRGCGG